MTGGRPDLTWTHPRGFSVAGVEFVESYSMESTAERFHIRKRRQLVEDYVRLLREFDGGNIVELGIAAGGSLALLALVASPRRVVALELSPVRIDGLDDFIAQRGLGESVRPYFGIDQADEQRIREIIDDEFGDEPIDLVIDDASHLLSPTRSSFEALFPRVRPGGLYLIEDWNWQQKVSHGYHRAAADPTLPEAHALRDRLRAALDADDPEVRATFDAEVRSQLADKTSRAHQEFADSLERRLEDPEERARFEQLMIDAARRGAAVPGADEGSPGDAAPDGIDDPLSDDGEPLAALVIDLLIARGCDGEVVRDVVVGEFWAAARRGPAPLDPATFRLDDIYADPYGLRWG